MIEAFKDYFDAIKGLDASDATEHTLRPALQNLLTAIANPKKTSIKIIHEPKKDKTGKGAPDFKFKVHEAILGYLENKKIDENLDAILKSAQIAKYKQLSGNIIITNYLEWVWLRDGTVLARETLCYQSDVGNRKARLDPDKAVKVTSLIEKFYSTPPKAIARAKDLALALATRCHDLRDVLHEELERQEKEDEEGRLWGLYNIFKQEVFHELNVKEFADAFAQTLGYGLFLARLNMANKADFKLRLNNAKQFIPASFELIRELVNFLDELEKDEYLLARQPVDEILSIMNTLDLAAIQEDLAFTKKQGKLLPDTEEERLLFAKDPYVYFYEDFLKAYDSAMRKGRGVYYTPPPVVNFIIRAINDILKDTFGISQGLADRKKVTVLDFATGTGTFLIEILQQIFENTSEGVRDQVVKEHILKNLYGFEYLIAPYTIAHLKLSQFLRDKGYNMQPKERLQIYLTNTLEPIAPQTNFLLPALSKEVKDAQAVKDKKILVITGNPPYSGESKNKGEWICGLIDTYKQIDGQPIDEKNLKWLNNDYVKFIRFAQWKMSQVEEGIVGIITSHSFLDSPTFLGMRYSLMQTFNQIHILDLQGHLGKKVITADGSRDENVFDIEEGVAISLFVKRKGLERGIYYSDLRGSRKNKYYSLLESNLDGIDWLQLIPSKPFYFFIPRNEKGREKYEKGWKVADIFSLSGDPAPGIVTTHDKFAISYTENEAIKKVGQLISSENEEDARKLFRLCSQDQWNYDRAKLELSDDEWKKELIEILYRPFDVRWTIYNNNVAVHLRKRVTQHMLRKDNIALVTSRMTKGENFKHAQVTDKISEAICISPTTSNNGFVFPLYIYNFPDDKKPKASLFDEEDKFGGKERIENFAPEFRTFIDTKYGKHYTPEQVLGYIYAVLHSPTYRNKYLEFLKIDFPRIPFVDDAKLFEKLSALGWDLVQAHLLKTIPATPKVEISKGSLTVEKPVYDEKQQRLYINKERYFSPVPKDVWEFHIGGYQVLDKYLKSRKGRELTLDEMENIQNVVKVLALTITQMQKIDNIKILP